MGFAMCWSGLISCLRVLAHKTPVCKEGEERKARYRSTGVIVVYLLRLVTTSKIIQPCSTQAHIHLGEANAACARIVEERINSHTRHKDALAREEEQLVI
jgi:hypothetical protein